MSERYQPTTVSQPPPNTSSSGRVRLNREYIFSLPGLIRILLILFQFAGWVSAAAAVKFGIPPSVPLRDAYLFFSLVGFFIAIFIFLLIVLDLIKTSFLKRLPWALIILITDAVWILPTFILAVICAVDEGKYGEFQFMNKGALGSAAFFGFCCTILYIADAIYFALRIKNDSVNTTVANNA